MKSVQNKNPSNLGRGVIGYCRAEPGIDRVSELYPEDILVNSVHCDGPSIDDEEVDDDSEEKHGEKDCHRWQVICPPGICPSIKSSKFDMKMVIMSSFFL